MDPGLVSPSDIRIYRQLYKASIRYMDDLTRRQQQVLDFITASYNFV